MSYSDEVGRLLQKHFEIFEKEHPNILVEDDLHELANHYADRVTLVDNYHEVALYVKDSNVRDAAEWKMTENDYGNLVSLFNDALQYVLWDYIISNYMIEETNEDDSDDDYPSPCQQQKNERFACTGE